MHRPNALELAKNELAACLSPPSPEGKELSCPRLKHLSLLNGVLLLSSGEAQLARTQLESLPAPKGLEHFHAWYRAEAQLYSGDRKAALSSLRAAQKKAPASLSARIEAKLAEVLLDDGQFQAAAAQFEKLKDVEGSPELLYGRGLSRWYAGQSAKGQADLKKILITFPHHPHAALARSRLEATAPVVFTLEERIERAQRLGPKDALAELDGLEVPANRKGPKAVIAMIRAGALFAQGKEDEGNQQLELALAGPPAVASEALMFKARRLMRANDNQAGRALMLQVDEKYPEQPVADEAAYLASWMALQAGEHLDAVKGFEAFEEKHADSRKLDEARWFRGFALFRAGQYLEARAVLQSLLTDFPRTSLLPQAKYWSARAAQLSLEGRAGAPPPKLSRTTPDGGTVQVALTRQQIEAEYREVIESARATFYALLAQERLREMGLEPPPVFTVEPKAPAERAKPPAELSLAFELTRCGLIRDANEEVLGVVGSISGAEKALELGGALQSVGDFAAAHTLAARYLWGAVYAQQRPEAVALMYPRAFKAQVEAAASSRGIEPALAWAIMRRESAFRPEVTSSADARGLMQIIPPTARAIARELQLQTPEPDELYAPELNIMLSAWYLSALMNRLGHPTLAAGAYNGGPGAVAKWATQRSELPLDVWVELIPYKETRGYVKQVTADLFIYRTLYGPKEGAPQRLSLQIPAPKSEGVSF